MALIKKRNEDTQVKLETQQFDTFFLLKTHVMRAARTQGVAIIVDLIYLLMNNILITT